MCGMEIKKNMNVQCVSQDFLIKPTSHFIILIVKQKLKMEVFLMLDSNKLNFFFPRIYAKFYTYNSLEINIP